MASHVFQSAAEALAFCKNKEGIDSCTLHCGTVNKMLFDAADAHDNDGYVKADSTESLNGLDYKNTTCGVSYSSLSNDPEVVPSSNGSYEWSRGADGAVGVRVGDQHYYFTSIASWESSALAGSRQWCSSQPNNTCQRVGCLDPSHVTMDTVQDDTERQTTYTSNNVNPSCSLTSNYLTGSYDASSGGYLFGDAEQNEQKWLVIEAEIGSGDSRDRTYYKYGCGTSCADTWANAGKAFCETHDCNWVKVHNVAPGVTVSDVSDGEIKSWYTNNKETSHLFKENHDASLGQDDLQSDGTVKREDVVVVTTVGDTVDDTPDATGPIAKTYRMETGGECALRYNGKGGGHNSNFWPHLDSHYFGTPGNGRGGYTTNVVTTEAEGYNDTLRKEDCSTQCANDANCAGYYLYTTTQMTGMKKHWCSQLQTDYKIPGPLYQYVESHRDDDDTANELTGQQGVELCLKIEA